MLKDYIYEILLNARGISISTKVLVVCNVKNITKDYTDYQDHSVSTDYFSENEINYLIDSCKLFGYYIEVYFDELDFLKELLENNITNNMKLHCIVYDTAQKGNSPGRRAFMPLVCSLFNFKHTSPNGHVSSLINSKYDYTKLLEYHGLPVPKTWRYSSSNGWLNNLKPSNNEEIIIKLTYEAASIGVSNESKTRFNKFTSTYCNDISSKFNQPLIVQKFIKGYEVEVPVIITKDICTAFQPVGLKIDNQENLQDMFFSYDRIFDDNYSFYDYELISTRISTKLKSVAVKAAQILGIEGYCRIDFRVEENGRYYIIDVNINPHIVEHSSFSYAFSKMGFKKQELLPFIIGLKLFDKY